MDQKYILLEIARGKKLQDISFTNHKNNIYKFTYSNYGSTNSYSYGIGAYGHYPLGSSGNGTVPEGYTGNVPVIKVGSLFVDSINYTQVDSLSELEGLVNTFYYDIPSQILYINFDVNDSPYYHNDYRLGITSGYANIEGYYGQVFYEGRIVSLPDISITKDNSFDGIVQYSRGQISLINKDGIFDDLNNDDIYGQRCSILTSTSTDISTFKYIYTGYIESVSIDSDNCILTFKDERKKFEKKIPSTVYTLDEYPNLKDSNSNKVKPIAYGKINNATAICLNEELETIPDYYTFSLADTSFYSIKAIDKVYIENVEVAFINVDLNKATFQLSKTVYTKGKNVTATFQGYEVGGVLIENPLFIIRDVISKYLNTKFSSRYFNVESWTTLENSNLPKCNLYIDEPTTLIDIINQLSISIMGIFIMEKDGVYNYKIQEDEKESVRTIDCREYLEPVKLSFNQDKYANIIRVGYSKDQNEDEYQYEINNSFETSLKLKYRIEKQTDLETNLVNKEDAVAYGNKAILEYGGIYPEYTFATSLDTEGLEILDCIDIELYQIDDNTVGKAKCIVTSITYNYLSNKINYKARWIKDINPVIDIVPYLVWDNTIMYKLNDVVYYNGILYKAILENQDIEPTNNYCWNRYANKYWDYNTYYDKNEIVVYEGKQYIALAYNIESNPTNTDKWIEGYIYTTNQNLHTPSFNVLNVTNIYSNTNQIIISEKKAKALAIIFG